MASASDDEEVIIWNLRKEGEEDRWAPGSRFKVASGKVGLGRELVFSPDSNLVAIYSPVTGGVLVWDLIRNRERAALSYHSGGVNAVVFSPEDPSVLASAGRDNCVILWSLKGVEEGGVVKVSKKMRLLGHTASVNALVFLDHGHLLASADDDGSIRFWDIILSPEAAAAQRITLRGHRGQVKALADVGTLISAGGMLGSFGELNAWRGAAKEAGPAFFTWGHVDVPGPLSRLTQDPAASTSPAKADSSPR